MERTFQVDLRGVVDLLSNHLYSSPRVYLRELLQNAVDAVTARRQSEPEAPATVTIEPPETTGDGTLRIHDSGIGLTEDEVHELLATIGRSSKRDDLGFARHEFLGQFGIGLLSCFLVADEVRVVTRSARGGPTVRWTGFADGRYRVAPAPERGEPGTTVTLVPRPGLEKWFGGELVAGLAETFGDLLAVPVAVAGRRVNTGLAPWRRRYSSPSDRASALARHGERLFGFTAFDTIDLHVPQAGLTGVAFVLPVAANPAAHAGHRVYLRGMLLADDVNTLVPNWAFFVRCVVDSSELRPTASREALYDDDLLAEVRESLGTQIRDWLVQLSVTAPERLGRFLRMHHLGVKAMATHDLEMLRIVDLWWPMETSAGPMTLSEFRRQFPTVRYTVTADQFRELAGVANAQGLGIVNGGYAYDIEIMKRLPELDSRVTVGPLDTSDLVTRFDPPDAATAARLGPLLAAASAALAPVGCAAVARGFDPPSVPVLYLTDRAAAQAREFDEARERATGFWGELLAAVGGTGEGTAGAPPRPQLVLNLRSPVVGRLLEPVDPGLAALAVQSLYGHALLQGQHPLGPADSALLDEAFLGLLDRAVRPADGGASR